MAVESFTVTEGYALLSPVMMYIMGMVVYALFIFNFYRFMARREILTLDLDKYNTTRFASVRKIVRSVIHVFEYALFLPIVIFFWFLILTLLLVLLSKQQPIEDVARVSISVVCAVRVTAYYTEDLSRDLAKMLPFALLGIFLVDSSFFSLSDSATVILQIPFLWRTFAYYLLFVIILEFILKILYVIFGRYLPGHGK